MYISLHGHGGFCCGAKHIYGFSYGPTHRIKAVTMDWHQENVKTYRWMIFVEGSVEETCLDRLTRTLRHVKKSVCSTHTGMHRPAGQLVQVTLTSSQQSLWHQTLLDLGFEVISTWMNSNTANEIKMYHLYIDRNYDKADEPKPVEPKKAAVKAPAFQRTTVPAKKRISRRGQEII